ncbi:hypothetical protein K3495_g4711 [Podosphaera aphanis]|nr:hypothetical protein K3495_g4711 [Podosphaera aphanis]
MNIKENAIQSASADLNSGNFKTQRAAARAYKVSLSTLHGRIHGSTKLIDSHQYLQRSTPEQKNYLVQWILVMDSKACPPSPIRTREMATLILRCYGDQNPLGKKWISTFIKRNPRISSAFGRKIEKTRAGQPLYLKTYVICGNYLCKWWSYLDFSREM